MGLKRQLGSAGNLLLRRLGAELVGIAELDRYRTITKKFVPVEGLSHGDGSVPKEAATYLRPDNPRLVELRSRYNSFNCPAIRHSIWGSRRTVEIDLPWFRGDNPYVFQFLDFNSEVAYILTAYYIQTHDRMDLLHKLKEDGLFGAHTFSFNDELLVSRDLLDSISEIIFLDQVLELSKAADATILEIGAGYGRLPHRLVSALPNLKRVYATDAIPESTFLSEFYIKFRNVADRVRVVPLDEIEELFNRQKIDYALNIHSFSECTLSTVCWWLDQLSRHGVRYLLIIPNAKDNLGTKLLTTESGTLDPIDYLPELERRGYRRIMMRPKYLAPSVQRHGISPTHFHLFELADWRPAL